MNLLYCFFFETFIVLCCWQCVLLLIFFRVCYYVILLVFLVVIVCLVLFFFFFKQKTAYEMRISDWSSDVCSSDLRDVVLCLCRESHDRNDTSPSEICHRPRWQSADDCRPSARQYPSLGDPAQGRGCRSGSRRVAEPRRGLRTLYPDGRGITLLAVVHQRSRTGRPADHKDPAIPPLITATDLSG